MLQMAPLLVPFGGLGAPLVTLGAQATPKRHKAPPFKRFCHPNAIPEGPKMEPKSTINPSKIISVSMLEFFINVATSSNVGDQKESRSNKIDLIFKVFHEAF